MKNESLSKSERIEAFARELALSLRRITGRTVESDLPPVVQPVVRAKDIFANVSSLMGDNNELKG